MRAKPELVPDCDVHGERMFRAECSPAALGLPGRRDVIVWRCAHEGCGRYFEGSVGYRDHLVASLAPTPRCVREGAFLVVQRTMCRYICPVAGCPHAQAWNGSGVLESEDRWAEPALGRMK